MKNDEGGESCVRSRPVGCSGWEGGELAGTGLKAEQRLSHQAVGGAVPAF